MNAPRLSAALLLAAAAAACGQTSGQATEPAKPGAAASSTSTHALTLPASSPEAIAIRKALTERFPQFPSIEEISRSPIAGLYEVRYSGSEILYSDATGEHIIIRGAIIETRTRTDLTEARLEKLLAIDFAQLPLKDAIVIKQGAGTRKVAVFVDPNCGYCKRFERDLAGIKDLTVYTFLLPILGPDSTAKSNAIWCAKDGAKAWRAWMLDGVVPEPAKLGCDTSALERTLAFGRKYRINGTPAVVFEDGTRKPGALPADVLEKLLVAATKKS
jgi:thiol:disulfide interchange protein DsbC